MTIIYYEDDGDISHISLKNIGIIGYGNLGRPIALNLREGGMNVVVGTIGDESIRQARQDGMPLARVEDIVRDGHIIMMLLADEIAPQVYIERISPYLQQGHTLIFASGYNIAFGFIEPPPFVDVGMIAPRTFGERVRSKFEDEQGFYSFVGVGQDASGTVWNTVLALAKAIGSLKAGAVEVTMEQEAELDLFMQQAILPAVHHILTTGAEILLKAGYPSEAAMMDMYISGELNDYLDRAATSGLFQALRLLTATGQYGVFSRLERFKDLKMERLMEVSLDEIRDGRFSLEWSKEYTNGTPRLKRMLEAQEDMDLWDVEQQTIELLNDDQAFFDDDRLFNTP